MLGNEYIADIESNKYYFGFAKEMSPTDDRHKEWSEQRQTLGFDDTETWSLKTTISKFILPRLKHFKERHFDHPCDITFEKWDEILDKMIFSFDYYANDKLEIISEENFEKVKEGMNLFARYFGDLWW